MSGKLQTGALLGKASAPRVKAPEPRHASQATSFEAGPETPESIFGAGLSTLPLRPSMSAHIGHLNIIGDDEAKNLVTRALLGELAPLLGLDLSRIEIRINSEAESRVNAQGASGVSDAEQIFLHPDRYRPRETRGRYLLAHEATHAAQREVSIVGNRTVDPETEAHDIATAFAMRRRVRRPRARLGRHAIAADTGTPATQEEIKQSVNANRQGELQAIKDALGGLWISDGDVFDVLKILKGVSVPTGRALLSLLSSGERHDLVNNINPPHYSLYRAKVLLCYSSLSPQEVEKFDEDLLIEMPLANLSLDEAMGVDNIFEHLKQDDQKKLTASKNGPVILEVKKIASDPDMKKGWEEEEQKRRDQAVKDEKEVAEQRHALTNLESGDKPKAAQVVEIAKAIKKQLSGWWISDNDVREAMKLVLPIQHDGTAIRALAHALTVDLENPEKKEPPDYKEDKDYLDVLIDQFPKEDLRDQSSPQSQIFLQLLMCRPGFKNEKLASKLTSGFFTKLWMNGDEAYLAFQLVKALPSEARKAFTETENWSVIQDKMSLSQREGEATNLYTGGKDQKDRDAILSQLLDDDVWTYYTRLSGVIQMAIAAGEYRWVFDESKRRYDLALKGNKTQAPRKPYEDKKLLDIIERFSLYNPQARDPKTGQPKPRLTPQPHLLESTGFWDTGIAGVLRQLGGAISLWFSSLNLGFTWDSLFPHLSEIKARGLNLAEAQDLAGGSAAGLRFNRLEDLGPEGEKAAKEKSGVNFANLDWDKDGGSIVLRAESLNVAAIHLPIGEAKYQTGNTTLNTLAITLKYPTEHNPSQPHLIDVSVGQCVLHDVLLIKPDSMISCAQLALRGLSIQAYPSRGLPQEGVLDAGIASTVRSVFQEQASKEGLTSALLAPSRQMQVIVSVDSLDVKGITTSGGKYIESLQIADFLLNAGGDVDGYVRALNASLKRLEQRLSATKGRSVAPGSEEEKSRDAEVAQIEKQVQRVHEQQDSLKAKIKRAEELHGRRGNQPNELTPDEQKELQQLEASLAGGTLDVGSVKIARAQGLPVSNINLNNVHGQGANLPGLFALAGDQAEFASQFISGRKVVQGLDKPGGAFALDVGDVELPDVRIERDLPTVEEAQKDVEKFKTSAHPDTHDYRERLQQLEDRVANARVYNDGLKFGVAGLSEDKEGPNKSPVSRTEFAKALAALRSFEKENALQAKSVKFKSASFQGGEDGKMGLRAAALDVEGAYDPKSGMRVASLRGNDVYVGAKVEGGLVGLANLRSHLKRGDVSAKNLEVSGFSDPGSGIGFEKLRIRDLEAGANLSADTDATLKAGEIEVSGASWVWTERVLRLQRDRLQKKEAAKRSPAEKKQLEGINEILKSMAAAREHLAAAEAILQDDSIAEDKKRLANTQRTDALAALAAASRRAEVKKLTIRDLDIGISGLGDALKENYSISDAMKAEQGSSSDPSQRHGISVQGKGKGGQIISGATIEGGQLLQPDKGTVGVNKVDIGPVRGGVTYANDHLWLDKLELDEISVGAFQYSASPLTIRGAGATTIKKVRVTGRIDTSLVDENAPDGERYTSHISITEFHIDEISAGHLSYLDAKKGLTVDIRSGKLKDIYAKGVEADLPKTEDDNLKFTAGTAGLAALDQAQVAATTASGMTVSGTVNAKTLAAHFASDGTQDFDLSFLSFGGKVTKGTPTQKEIDLNINVKAKGIHATLKGKETSLRAADVSGDVSGTVKGTEVAADFEHLDTGKVTMIDGWIFMPDLQIKSIHLTKIKYESDDYRLETLPGGKATFNDFKANITLEPNKEKEAEEKKTGKVDDDIPSYKKIVLQEFRVPTIEISGFEFTLKKKDWKITLPKDKTGYLRGLGLTPETEQGNGLVLEFNQKSKNWHKAGSVKFDTVDLAKVAAQKIDESITATADIHASNFQLDFLGEQRKEWTLAELSAKDIDAKIKKAGSVLQAIKLGSLTAKGIHQNDDGSIDVDSIAARTFEYRNFEKDVVLNVKKADLSKGLKYIETDHKVLIPKASISDADIELNDISKLSSGAKGGPAKKGDYDYLDDLFKTMNGTLDVEIYLPIRVWQVTKNTRVQLRQDTWPVKVGIRDGVINFESLLENAVWARYRDIPGGPKFVIGKDDAGNAMLEVRAGGDLQKGWVLTQPELALAKRNHVKILTLLTPHETAEGKRDREAAEKDPAEAKRQEDASKPRFDEARLVSAHGYVSFYGASTIDLGKSGRIHMGAGQGFDAISGLRFDSADGRDVTLGFDEVNAWLEGFMIGDYKVNTDLIHVSAVRKAHVTFDGLKPKTFKGSVSSAVAENIEVVLPEDAPAAKGPSTTQPGKQQQQQKQLQPATP